VVTKHNFRVAITGFHQEAVNFIEEPSPLEVFRVSEVAGDRWSIGLTPPAGRLVDLGPTAVIDTGEVMVVVISNSSAVVDEDCFTEFGFGAADFDHIALHPKTHFCAVYEPIATAITIVERPIWAGQSRERE
jgi:microcystin degradation protein MlrC